MFNSKKGSALDVMSGIFVLLGLGGVFYAQFLSTSASNFVAYFSVTAAVFALICKLLHISFLTEKSV